MGVPVRHVGMAALLCGLVAVPPSLGAAKAQQANTQRMSQVQSPGPPTSGANGGKDPIDAAGAELQAKQARSASSERQKRIVDDTAKLLQLATELKANVDKTTKEELSLDVIRKADEIERLAHDVKQRMRG